jgi:outer membrane receptor protein involved in Fe transport
MRDRAMRHTRPSAVAGAILAIAANAAFGQRATPTADAASAGLEEVVVTARKRAESLQDVPVSITAFTDEAIEKRGIESVYDIARLTPNLSFNQTYGRVFDRPVIRGQSQILGERTVSFVVDGVYIAGNMSADLDDIEQVEVLKGPQAANFGRGSLAGVISYRTRKPTNDWDGKVSLSIGDYDHREVAGFVSGPLGSDKLSFKLGARYYDFGGQYTALSTDNSEVQLGEEKTKRVSGALRWQPTESLDLILRAFAAQNQDGLYNNIIFRNLNCFTTVTGARGGSYCGEIPVIPVDGGVRVDFADIARQGRPGVEQDTNLFSLEGAWTLGLGTLTGIVSWNRQDEDWIVDDYLVNAATGANGSQVPSATMTRANPGNITRLITVREYRSQELRFASTTEGKIDWMVGAYHYDSDAQGFNGGPRYNILVPVVVMGVTTLQPAATNTGPVGTLREISQRTSPSSVDNRAVFASVNYDPTDSWHLTLEARYARDELTTNNTVQAGGNCERVLNAEFSRFTPRFTARFDFTDDMNIYLSIARGTKPGDFNNSLCAANMPAAEFARLSALTPLEVKEEKAVNYELGSKLRFLDGRMSLDTAVFFIDWTNQQLTSSQVYRNTGNTVSNISLTSNVGKTEAKGLELNWRWKATDMWDFNVGYGYTDAEFKEACDSTYAAIRGVTLATQVEPCVSRLDTASNTTPPPVLSAAGFQTANAPKHTVNGGIEFGVPLGDKWRFIARGDVSYQSERFAEIYNDASTGSSTRFDARLGLEMDAFRITAWGKNLGNDRSPDAIVRFFDPDSLTFNRAYQVHYPNGRTVGVTATYDF